MYAHAKNAGDKQPAAAELIRRLIAGGEAALSIPVLAEFYWAATGKLHISSSHAEQVLADFGSVTIHRSGNGDLLRAVELQRHHPLAWWDALVVNSAIQLGCAVLWTEDLSDGQQLKTLTVRNPFRT
ncbi:MAG TPA: PIN domain-containing protein [Bryobacteraceae bacterium]